PRDSAHQGPHRLPAPHRARRVPQHLHQGAVNRSHGRLACGVVVLPGYLVGCAGEPPALRLGDPMPRTLPPTLPRPLLLAPPPGPAATRPAGFVALFGGKSLDGWQLVGSKKERWKAEKGLLVCTGGGGGWLMSKKEYADFELKLEYRLAKMGNSGVAIRSPL